MGRICTGKARSKPSGGGVLPSESRPQVRESRSGSVSEQSEVRHRAPSPTTGAGLRRAAVLEPLGPPRPLSHSCGHSA